MKKILLVVLVLLQTGLVLPVFPAQPTDEQMEGRLSNYCTDSRFKRRRYANYCKKVWVKDEKVYCTYAADKPRYKLAFGELCGDVKVAAPAKPAASGQEKKALPAASGDADRELWNLVKDSNDENMIKMYLQTYPQGQYAVHARVLLLKLKKSANAQTPASQSPAPKTSPPAAEKGSIRISSKPSRASIFINDVFSGTSPLDIRLKPGIFTIAARKKGFKSASRNIQVFEGTDISLNLVLEALGNVLSIDSRPSGADVYIDDDHKGRTPIVLDSLDPNLGLVIVEIKKDGYDDWHQTVNVADKNEKIMAELQKEQRVSLTITSQPSGAAVYIDDMLEGKTPWFRDGLAPGSRFAVRVNMDGYKNWQQTVTLKRNNRRIHASLSRKQTAPADMVLIKAGEFLMGSEDGDSDEQPVHRVYLDAYYIDKHEVTVAAYRKCVSAGSCREFTTRYWSGKDQGRSSYCNWTASGREQHPINCLDWPNAKAYCEWAGKRLPTEAEWEKAATWKNGTKYKYPSGKNTVSCDDAVMDDSGDGCGKVRTWEVGSKPEEINGTYDMAGNVWEWVADWYGDYSGGNQRNPTGPATGSYRVDRGGSCFSNASDLRGANRNVNDPSSRGGGLGFRCARSPK